MPERIAIHKLTIGGEKGARREVMPGQRFTCDSETAAELDTHNPPAVRRIDQADPAPASGDTDIVRQVAEPATEENVTREQPAGAGDDDEL